MNNLRPAMLMVFWDYGGLAIRTDESWPLWSCADSDYTWKAVIDDFGTLVPVTPYVNSRGY